MSSITELPKKRFSRPKPSSSSSNHHHRSLEPALNASHLNHLINEESLSTSTSPPSHGSSTLNEEDKKDMKVKTAELSSLFLGIRRSMVKGLILDSMDSSNNKNNDLGQILIENEQHSNKKFSSSTLVRAERVKFTIELHYMYLKRQIDVKRLDPITNEPLYPHVEGVYNPLQVIRNRKLYKKYKQIPKRLDLKLITPASQAFSEKKDKRLKWQVDVREMVHDFNFRTQHFNELKNPHMELWFPVLNLNNDIPKNSSKPLNDSSNGGGRLHEKLFDFPIINIEDEEGRLGRSSVKSISSRSSSQKQQKRFSRSPVSLFRHSNSHNIKDRDSKTSSINLVGELAPPPPTTTTTTVPIPDLRKDSKNSSASSSSNLLLSPIKSVNIKSYKHKREPSIDIDRELTPTFDGMEDDRLQLCRQQNMLKKLKGLVLLGERNLQNKPIFLDNKVKQFIDFRNEELDKIMSNYQDFNTNLLKFEKLIGEINESTTDYKNHLGNKYSNKIDVLLSLSDRTIGEINTSLTLETRRLKERLEKLDSNLYSSLTGDSTNDFLIKMVYYLLENLIGFLLLIIWFLYTIFRFCQIIIMSIFKFLKWLIH